MQNIGNVQRPQWYPQMELNTGQFMAGGVIVARLAQERRGWQVGEAVFQKDKEAAASIRRAFGAEDAKATLRAYRLQKQEANLSPKVLARVVYHLRYLSV